MAKAEIGLIGAGVMGSALSLNFAEKGYPVALHDRDLAKAQATASEAKSQGLDAPVIPIESLEELAASLKTPRAIILLVPAGPIVDQVIDALTPLLSQGDVIVDAGNADFHNTRARTSRLEDQGFAFLGLGVSGGSEGARHGPSIMAGGSPALWERVSAPLKAISARYEGQPCCDWFGPDGAGSFVKTIHNGVEYADMQMIAEAYGVMRDMLGMEPDAIAATFAGWMKGPLNSFLIEITADHAATMDESGAPLLDLIQDKAGQKGTGRWSAIEALSLDAPASAIEAAVAARNLSAQKERRVAMSALYYEGLAPSGADQAETLATLEQALVAGKIVAYAQGFEIFRGASAEYAWGLDRAAIARVWRAGCIIRSVFLDHISDAFAEAPDAHLMETPYFAHLMRASTPGLRQTVGACAANGVAAPALSAALAYFDMIRTARGTANMVQLQRDIFGHHGFERVDREGGGHHGPWVG
ncbi:MAG: NADP-dependent phosphogluconate dehydrogenase [Pseudomonadota bacterium]